MLTKKRVLIFPCGSEIGLEINRALSHDIHFEMFGASSIPDHGKFVFKNYIDRVPFVNDENFIDEIEAICQKYNIDFIIPAHDSVVLKLAQNSHKLSAKVITSPKETCETARSKKKTYEILKNTIKCPKIYQISDKNIPYPVFIKPDVGQGSKGAAKIMNFAELKTEFDKNPDIIISEFLPGKEYTIDCFTNRHGQLLFAKGRVRARISNGISVNSYPVDNNEFYEIAEKINNKLKFQGMWFFQLKSDKNGELTLLEIAPRIAGTMGMYRGLGINFAQLALYDAMENNIKVIENNFYIETDRALFSRYKHDISYEYVYIDLDDTILLDDKINLNAIKFLYQAKNENKKIILITKHEKIVEDTLFDFCISKNLFSEIISVKKNDKKSRYITHQNAIFIDDSFAERLDVAQNLQIPVFGIDAIEVLTNYKT